MPGFVVGYDGVKFPATQVPSSDPNTLDDYEEGAWTPTDGSGAALTFASASGTYEKIGRQVTARGAVTYPATANGSQAFIGSLPFTVANADDARQGFISFADESTLAYVTPNKNSIVAALFNSSFAAITNATMSGNTVFFTLIYNV